MLEVVQKSSIFNAAKKVVKSHADLAMSERDRKRNKKSFIVEYSVALHPSWMDLVMDNESLLDQAAV